KAGAVYRRVPTQPAQPHPEEVEEAEVNEEEGLEDVAPEEEEEAPVEEEAAAEEEEANLREEDLELDLVPEDMREAVEGSLHLKRMLNTGNTAASDPAAKKRKLAEDAPMDAERKALMDRWRMGHDKAVRYVLLAADIADVQALAKTAWRPTPFVPAPQAGGRDGKTVAEQINEKLLLTREISFCSKGEVDFIAAFAHRWNIVAEDKKVMESLNHKDLRHVLEGFDGIRTIEELVDEAAMMMPNEEFERAQDAAPEKPGLLTIGRFNRLELIDPNADALIIGDANLTFAILLAKHREGLGHVGRIVATTFENIEQLRERYDEIDETVKWLESKNCEVLHNVDGTRLAVDPRFQGMENKFGAVYYNFPHAGVVQGFFDGHPFVRWRHENLMHLFFRALRGFVKKGGIVKVSSNSCATGVRYSDIISAAQNSEFVHVETIPLPEWQLRDYLRSYGDRRDKGRRPGEQEIYRNQRANSDMVYAFSYEPTGDNPPKPIIRHPPTKDDMLYSTEGKLKSMNTNAKASRVEEIYQLFLTYVQGIHVG
ncbi:unnamed protein product, partial [Polarella glacialis]